ncbi:cytochrome b6 [Neisseria chenwenguii]|uniref:Cytochrome b6 n=1 Tax=Neisseria chenwenguii TaxID=1853278 RepID=A0A220RZ68_9NEIS|nr:cytochrome b6 [Neisseria chenwenguii]ASK26463.1 cytochrome b6 [Neisseria chenwenguii]ROV55905.1 cytochrome b6 [Neisseria chenwenguii]
MNADLQIRAHTRYAFAAIVLMLLAFASFVALKLLPLGLSPKVQKTAVETSLYALVLFTVAGGAFSMRVAVLRKRLGK